MAEPRAVNIWNDPARARCRCVKDHNPNAITFDEHHIVPLAWGGSDGEGNIEVLCPTTHRAAHLGLDLLRKYDGLPPWEKWKSMPMYARQVARRGYYEWRRQT